MKSKNLYRIAMLFVVMAAVITAAVASIKVEVNDKPLTFSVPPQTIQNRTMVPLRGIFEALGAQVIWDATTRTITANKANTNVQLSIGNTNATVNGKTVILDAPPMIIRGSTMVPLRFVSEALGADVKWLEATKTVSIYTKEYDATGTEINKPTTGMVIIPSGTVVPVSLDKLLSSATNNQGDEVKVTVSSTHNGDAEFPQGTTIFGKVTDVQRKSKDEPGMIALAFQKAILPNGNSVAITGSLISLDEKSVTQSPEGRLIAKNKSKDESLKFIAIGTGAGLLIGKLLDKNLITGGLLGAAAGYIYSEISKDNAKAKDVSVPAGTEFGVRLDSNLKYTANQDYIIARNDYLREASSNTPK